LIGENFLLIFISLKADLERNGETDLIEG